MSGLGERLSRANPLLADSVLALVLWTVIELTCWLTPGVSTHDRIVTAIAAVPFTAPIAARRLWPGAALVFSTAVVLFSTPFGSQLLTNDNAYILPTLLLSYNAGERLDAWRSRVALTISLILAWTWALLPSSLGGGPSASAVFFTTMLLIPTWVIGRYVHRYRRRTASFNTLAAQATANRGAHEATAIATERARIGAELQDIIAHSISAMVIQAGSARLLIGRDPERARSSILAVEETGRQALSDLRRLLGMLRKDKDPRALTPQPGLSQVAALIDSLRGFGLSSAQHTVGAPMDLTPGVDLVAYRVIEAALQAAAESHVEHSQVIVRYQPRDLELEVRGDGAIPSLEGRVASLVDRVALYDGELRAAASPDSFTLRARLPLYQADPA